jgi:hypothetical protein
VERMLDSEAKKLCIDSISLDISVVHLETSDNILIKSIISMYLYRDMLFVVHVDRCSVFNLKGEYLYDIGKYGQGSGEFASAGDIFFLDDYLGIFDYMKNIMLYYTIDGRFVYKYSLLPGVEKIKRIGKDLLVGIIPVRSSNRDIRMLFFDTKGNIIDSIQHKILPKPENMPYYINAENLFTYNNETYLKEGYNDTVFRISGEMKLLPQYIITAGKYSVNYDDMILDMEKYIKGKRPIVSFENDRYILSTTGEGNFNSFLIDKKTDRIEKVLLTYNEEMDELFEDDRRMVGGGTLYEPGFESFPTCFNVEGVSEDGKIILCREVLENSDDNPVIVMVRIKE